MLSFFNLNKKIYTLIFFLIFFLIGIYVFPDYGISIDEDETRIVGFSSLQYIYKIFLSEESHKISQIINNIDNVNIGIMFNSDVITSGVAFDTPMAFLELIFQINDSKNYYLLRHFFTFLTFFISVIFFFKIIYKRFNSLTLSLIGSLFLIISPRIFANSFYNNKDIIFMSLFIITIFIAIKFLEEKNLKYSILFALFSGLTINVRIFGLILPLLISLIYIINIFVVDDKKEKNVKPLIFIAFLIPLFIILFWPYLWEDPFDNFFNALKNLTAHQLDIYSFYLGKYIHSTNQAWHYPLVWIFITTPLFYIAMFIVGIIYIIKKIINRWLRSENNNSFINFWKGDEELEDVVFLSTFLAPLIITIYFGSISYDGWRHLFFIYPSFLLISIVGMNYIRTNFFKFNAKYFYVLILIVITPTIYWMYKNHPFQYVYFNTFAGKNFNEKYEMDYMGVSNKNVLEYILKDKKAQVKVFNLGTTDLNLSKQILEKGLREKVLIVGNINEADYITNNYRDWNGETKPNEFNYPANFKILNEIKVDGVAINTIYKKNK